MEWVPARSRVVGFGEERGRARRRLRTACLVGAVFCYGLLQVWMSTEVAERGARVSRLEAEIKKVEVDLAVSRARVESGQVYGELIASREAEQFGPGGAQRILALAETPATPAPGSWDQLAEELHRGSRLLLPDALAKDLWEEDQGLDARP